MRTRQSHKLDYAVPGELAVGQSRAGIVALVVALLLSPVVVFPVFVNDTTPEVLRPYSRAITIACMITSLVWPASAILCSDRGQRGRGWAIAGLVISLAGWGFILYVAIMMMRGGAFASGVGVH